MHLRMLFLLPMVCCSLGCGIGWRLNTIATDKIPPELQARATKGIKPLQLARLAAPMQEEYRLQAGDLIEVTVPDLIDETHADPMPTRVQEDGTIELPLVGAVLVADLSVPESEQAVARVFAERRILQRPRVVVSLREAAKAKINVLGAIRKAGQYELSGSEADLLSALVAAGGLTEDADTVIEVHRRALPPPEPGRIAATSTAYGPRQRPRLQRPRAQQEQGVLRLDLADEKAQQIIGRGIYLHNGDTVTVEQRTPKPVYVIGMVGKPGEYKMPVAYDLRVLDAVALAGGVDRMTLPDKAIVIRPQADQKSALAIRVDLNRAKRDMAQNLLLMPGDTVSVEETAGSFTRGLVRGAFRVGLGANVTPNLY